MYAILDYVESRIRICKAVSSAQVCKRKIKTGPTVLQDYIRFSSPFREERAEIHFTFKCSKYECRWLSTWGELSGGCRNMAVGANIKSITQWTETLN